MANTLLLDRTAWDLCIDASGNIAVASGGYALAQDAASAIKLFLGEYWYDTSIGIPYFEQVLGKNPPINLLKSKFQAAAMSVPGVTRAICYLSSVADGQVSGQVHVTDLSGKTFIAGF
jgi:hypothetical protein